MADIAALPWNGFNVVSTFSGCGGSCLGYRMAGYHVLWASEFIPAAQETYRANHPSSILDTRDIRTVSAEDILTATGLAAGELDLLDGSPPCAAFSTSGVREKGWGKVKEYSDGAQRVDNLFFEFSRLLRELQPRVFVAENVSGLIKGTAKGYFLQILAELKACGYRVKVKLLNSQWLGVPQSRERLIFIGVRDDLGIDPVFPRPLPYYYTAGEALRDVPKPAGPDGYHWLPAASKTLAYWQETRPGAGFDITVERLEGKIGSWTNHKKLSPNKPSNTVVQGGLGVYHWSEPRTMTIEELRRLSSFPDDFILSGTFPKQWERIGRAVPPVMMSHVAATIRDQILCKLTR